jgi:hypothetical protein
VCVCVCVCVCVWYVVCSMWCVYVCVVCSMWCVCMCVCLGDGAEAIYRTLHSTVLVSNRRSMMSRAYQARKQCLPLNTLMVFIHKKCMLRFTAFILM